MGCIPPGFCKTRTRTRTLGHGYGFSAIRVRVALENPRITRANPYHGVVGTMWNISDMHGPKFATEFYKYLLIEKGSKGLDSTQAAYALDYAVRKVQESLGDSNTAFLTWVPYVHFGY
jgi:hypothetical protein